MDTSQNDYKNKAKQFLAVAPQFRLGELPTEQPHPLTGNLSHLAKHDLAKALRLLHRIDCSALDSLIAKTDEITALSRKIADTIRSGNTIFLCGCGSTGRLSIACETLWRAKYGHTPLAERVVSFMAGGDAALVRAVENFEDHPEYGAHHLVELGFKQGDLLIACTEGGETPFVIGATKRAAEISSNSPYFLYCNPDGILGRIAQRSADILRNPRISKINCYTGPMALAGSTRMQASTVLMTATGYALLLHHHPSGIPDALESLRTRWKSLDPSFLEPFTVKESQYYQSGEYVLYETDRDLAITILTDTTERAPTFFMRPFESADDPGAKPSLCYLYLAEAETSGRAWELVLGRPPRTLAWENIGASASLQKLLTFDFSRHVPARRKLLTQDARHHLFSINMCNETMQFGLEDSRQVLETDALPMLSKHLMLKMLLNMHSTLVMGRLGRYDGNIMTWVKPANNKLIDRAIRSIDLLLKNKNISKTYEEIAIACFREMETDTPDRSIVHTVVEKFDTSGFKVAGNHPEKDL